MPYINNSFIPETFETIIQKFIIAVNEQFNQDYDYDRFLGTNLYKYFYGFAQDLQRLQVTVSEIFENLKVYFDEQNAELLLPSTTWDRLTTAIKNELGYQSSVKPMIQAEAGQASIAVLVPKTFDKDAILRIIAKHTSAGIWFNGEELGDVVMSNGQSLPFAFFKGINIPLYLRITITTSNNSQTLVPSIDDIKSQLIANLGERYAMGMDFAPERYFTPVCDAQYASEILLEYSTDNETWAKDVLVTDFKNYFTFNPDNITVVFR